MEYLEIVNWGDHLHPDTTRKAMPPYRWVKLESENLDTLGDLSLRHYGAFCRLLNLAALTNNRTVFDAKVIRRRTGVTQKDIENLEKRGLIKIVEKTVDAEKHEQNQSPEPEIASGLQADPPQAAAPEGKGEEGNGFDTRGLEIPESERLCPFPLPADSSSKRSGHDPRSFNDLKRQILAAARKLKTSDAQTIFNSTRQSLRMSQRQVEVCVHQLIEDNEL